MSQGILSRVVEVLHTRLSALRQFLKKNYRNYYDDRSWWDEVGSEESQR
jgi:hypothetical protein